jgi:putative hydrolase of the HAD superfamily
MDQRAIFFDVDGVVVHGFHARPEMRRRWDEHILKDLGIDPELLGREFFNGPFVNEVLTGRTSLIQALSDVLPTIGFLGSPLQVIDYWLSRDSQLNYQLLDVIQQLRLSGAGRVYLATNQEHLRAYHLWNGLGLKCYFDDIFYAARLGVLKPSPEFFQRIESVIGPQTEPPLLFDDSDSVVAGANRYGWEGVLFESVESCSEHPAIRNIRNRIHRPQI